MIVDQETTAIAARSIAFFSREPARSESSMATWAAIALLLVIVALAIGGPL